MRLAAYPVQRPSPNSESVPAQGLCYCDLESELPLVPALKKYLDQCEQSQSKAVEAAIRRTKAFRNWLAERANS